MAVVLGCLGLAALSLLLPSAPTTDSWGWIVWGREILHGDLSTAVGGAPSWKPLPVIATTPLALAGDAAPALWLLVARAGGLLSLLFAFRLGERLAGRAAGLLGAACLVLDGHWLRALAHGYTEPFAIGLLLAAVERQLAGRGRQALGLAALIALTRPEAWLLVVAYGLVLWRRREAPLGLVALVAVAVPALWLVPDWIGSGDPLHAGKVSRLVVPTGAPATVTALGEAALISPLPLLVTAVAGAALALRRGERLLPALLGVVLAWAGLLAAMMFAGYPASSRFFVVPAGLLTVVGAAGAVRLARAARPRHARAGAAPGLVALALGVVALAGLAPWGVELGRQARNSIERARLEADLEAAIDRARLPLRTCGTPALPRKLGWSRGVVAWELHAHLRRVRGVLTSAPDYIKLLSDPGGNAPPPPPARVAIRPRHRPFLVLAPFGDARLSLVRHPRVRLVPVAAGGRWRVVVPAGGRWRAPGCRAQA